MWPALFPHPNFLVNRCIYGKSKTTFISPVFPVLQLWLSKLFDQKSFWCRNSHFLTEKQTWDHYIKSLIKWLLFFKLGQNKFHQSIPLGICKNSCFIPFFPNSPGWGNSQEKSSKNKDIHFKFSRGKYFAKSFRKQALVVFYDNQI